MTDAAPTFAYGELPYEPTISGMWHHVVAEHGESELIVLCNHGYSSIFSAATLVDLGFTRAGDVVGGFRAWRAAGLPVTTAPSERRGADELAGMSSPDAG